MRNCAADEGSKDESSSQGRANHGANETWSVYRSDLNKANLCETIQARGADPLECTTNNPSLRVTKSRTKLARKGSLTARPCLWQMRIRGKSQ